MSKRKFASVLLIRSSHSHFCHNIQRESHSVLYYWLSAELCQRRLLFYRFFFSFSSRIVILVMYIPHESLAANCLRIESTYHRAVYILPWEVPRSCIHRSIRSSFPWILLGEGARNFYVRERVENLSMKSMLSSPPQRRFSFLFTELTLLTRSIKNYVHRCTSWLLRNSSARSHIKWVQITSSAVFSLYFHCLLTAERRWTGCRKLSSDTVA